MKSKQEIMAALAKVGSRDYSGDEEVAMTREFYIRFVVDEPGPLTSEGCRANLKVAIIAAKVWCKHIYGDLKKP
jgi:hypothetical protein